jgi:hypothetical protein
MKNYYLWKRSKRIELWPLQDVLINISPKCDGNILFFEK